jgi:hypothetical protein
MPLPYKHRLCTVYVWLWPTLYMSISLLKILYTVCLRSVRNSNNLIILGALSKLQLNLNDILVFLGQSGVQKHTGKVPLTNFSFFSFSELKTKFLSRLHEVIVDKQYAPSIRACVHYSGQP